MRHFLLAALSLVLVATGTAGSSGSSSFQADVEVQGLAAFIGDLSIETTPNALEHGPGASGLAIHESRGRFELWNVPQAVVASDDPSPLGRWEAFGPIEAQQVDSGEWTGEVSLGPVPENGFLTLSAPPAPATVFQGTGWLRQLGREAMVIGDSTDIQMLALDRFGDGWQPVGRAYQVSDGRPWSSPSMDLALFYGPQVLLGDHVFRTGEAWNDTASARDPVGWSHGGIRDRYVLLLWIKQGVTTIAADQVGNWSMHTRSVTGRLDGDLALSGVRGQVTWNTTDRSTAGEHLQVKGSFDVMVDAEPDHPRWQVAGEARFVGVDGATVAGSRYQLSEPLVIAGGAGILVVIWLILTRTGQGLLFLITGLGRDAALAHRGRSGIMQIIEEQPGITILELQETSGLSRASVVFHLAVLRRASLVETHQEGKRIHIMPNHGSYAYKVEGKEGPVDARVMVSLFHHPTRRTIFTILSSMPKVTEGELLSRWPTRPAPSRSTLRHHLQALATARMVQELPASKPRAWRACAAADVLDLMDRT